MVEEFAMRMAPASAEPQATRVNEEECDHGTLMTRPFNMKYVYGPVPSRRLGQSLGIDPIPSKTR
jgi:hypothetical protein